MRSPTLQMKIIDLIIFYNEVSSEIKLNFFTKLINSEEIEKNLSLVLIYIHFLDSEIQQEVMRIFIKRFIESGNFETILERLQFNQRVLVN